MINGSSLISGYFDGTLSEPEVAELNAWIAADPANARLFAKHALLHSHVQELLTSERSLRVAGAAASDHEQESHDPAAEFKKESGRAAERIQRERPRNPWRIRRWGWGLAAAAAIALLIGGITYVEISRASRTIAGLIDDDEANGIDAPAYVTADAGAVWDGPGATEDGQLSAGKELRLTNGYAEITFAAGAKVVLQAPARLTVNSATAMTLSNGRAAAVVNGGGFVVQTPSVKVTDLGTEFGVAVGNGQTRVEVFKGKVRTERALAKTAGTNAPTQDSRLLTAGEAATYSADSFAMDARGAAAGHFVRNLAAVTGSLDVVDLLCGGDGTTHRRGLGIDVATGDAGALKQIGRETGDDKFHPVRGLPAVDGSFVPDGTAGPTQIDSAGDLYLFPETSKISQGLLWAGGRTLDPFGNGLSRTVVAGVDYSEPDHGIVYMFTNKGITLNLDAIRKMHPGALPYEFRCVVGNAYVKSLRRQRTAPRSDLYILVDGQLRFEHLGLTNHSGAVPVNVRLKPADRFLTIVTTESDDTQKDDWLILGDPAINTMTPPPTTASAGPE